MLALVKLSERAAKVGFPWDLSWFKYLSWSIYLVYNELKSFEILMAVVRKTPGR